MKTKCIRLFLCTVPLALFIGCEEDLPQQLPLGTSHQEKVTTALNFKALYSKHHTMSWEDAALFAERSAECFLNEDNPSELRSGKQRRIVNNGFVLKKEKRNSLRNASIQNQLPDTLAYICNFADSMGFAIICADDRVGCPILACVDNGIIEDSVENPGLAIFLENAYDFIEDKILNFEEKKDSLRKIADEFIKNWETESKAVLKNVYTGTFTMTKDEEVKPLLFTTWGQSSSPYNDLTKTCLSDISGHAPAGCWATAIAQLMAYYKYPSYVEYVNNGSAIRNYIDWQAILQKKNASSFTDLKTRKQVANLLFYVGKNIKMKYDCDGSSTSEKDAMTYLKKIGYKKCDSQDYSFSKVRSELMKNRPVLMNGKKKKVLFVSYEGHAWVVDGYSTSIVEDYSYRIDMEKNESKYWVTKTVYKNSLLHINWGWAGNNNGYFAEGCFNTANAIQYDSQEGDSHSDYKYNNKIHIAWR